MTNTHEPLTPTTTDLAVPSTDLQVADTSETPLPAPARKAVDWSAVARKAWETRRRNAARKVDQV
jgi:hypothetical protein